MSSHRKRETQENSWNATVRVAAAHALLGAKKVLVKPRWKLLIANFSRYNIMTCWCVSLGIVDLSITFIPENHGRGAQCCRHRLTYWSAHRIGELERSSCLPLKVWCNSALSSSAVLGREFLISTFDPGGLPLVVCIMCTDDIKTQERRDILKSSNWWMK